MPLTSTSPFQHSQCKISSMCYMHKILYSNLKSTYAILLYEDKKIPVTFKIKHNYYLHHNYGIIMQLVKCMKNNT